MHLKELNEKDVIRVEHFRDTIQQGLNIEEGYNTSSYLKMNIRKMSANIEFYQRERPENLMKLTIEKFLTGLGIFGNKYRYRIYVILFLKKKIIIKGFIVGKNISEVMAKWMGCITQIYELKKILLDEQNSLQVLQNL